MWADALPNLLIGLREGLEGGLVVSILLAAVRKLTGSDSQKAGGSGQSTAPIWLGVFAAIVLALSFGAVLTFYRSVLSTTGQEALGGSLSVIAVVLVTGMIFWMRRTARSLSGELRAKVAAAINVSSAALALTAFLAVGREGVETALFLWTAAQASGQTVAPLIGAAIGIAIAVVLCVLLYRSAVRIQLGVFFNRTALLLIVVAAGVLSYGLGDLQDAGWLPGHAWVAFDLSQQIDASSWWATIISGITNLRPTMTWLQLVAYVVYLAWVMTVFIRANRASGPPRPPAAKPAVATEKPAEPTANPAAATIAAASAQSTTDTAQPAEPTPINAEQPAETQPAAPDPAQAPVAETAESAEKPAPETPAAEIPDPAETPAEETPAADIPEPAKASDPTPDPKAEPTTSPAEKREPAKKVPALATASSTVSVSVAEGPGAAPAPHAEPSRRRMMVSFGAALIVPPVVAAGLILFAPGRATAATQQISATSTVCASGWSSVDTGTQSFAITNKTNHAVEINLIQAATQGIVAEIETLGPATTQNISVNLTAGGYYWRCLADGLPTQVSPTVQVTGTSAASTGGPVAVKPITVDDLQPAATAYDAYVRPKLVTLLSQVDAVQADLTANNIPAAQADWLNAQLTWEQVGAAYDSFGDLGDAIDGLPQALPLGVNDPGWTGLHRLEYGLWHGQTPAQLLPVTTQLTSDITTLQQKLPQITVDPTDMPVRAHEILEDALRDHLNGLTDEGSGMAYAETYADVQGTQVVLGMLAPLINERAPKLLGEIQPQLTALAQALNATKANGQWQSPAQTPLAAQQAVNGTLGAVLENLSLIPDLLEVPAH